MITTFPREDEYYAKMATVITAWAEDHPERAAELLRLAIAQLAMPSDPPDDPQNVRRMIVTFRFRELVREEKRWPTYAEWIRGAKVTNATPKYLPVSSFQEAV